MTLRNFNNTAPPVELTAAIDAVTQTLPVSSTSGYPAVPFLLSIERGVLATEELVLCTAKSASEFTVTRGYDGTTAKTHSIGKLVEHSVASIDYREANTHVNDTTLHITPCTSGTRPGSPVLDQHIYERDTNRLMVWDGNSWEEHTLSSHTHAAGAHDHSGTYLPIGGGTLTGALTLSGGPSSDNHAARKKYVDDEIDSAVAGVGSPSGFPRFLGTKHYSFVGMTTYNPGGYVALNALQPLLSVTKQSATSKLFVQYSFTGYLFGDDGMIPAGGYLLTRVRTVGAATRTFGERPFYWNMGQVHFPIVGAAMATVADAAGVITVGLQVDTSEMDEGPLVLDDWDTIDITVWEIP